MRPLTAAYQAASSDHQVKKTICYFLWLVIYHKYVILKGQPRNQFCGHLGPVCEHDSFDRPDHGCRLVAFCTCHPYPHFYPFEKFTNDVS